MHSLGIEVLVDGRAWHAGVDPARLESRARELHPACWHTPAYKALLHAGLLLADTGTIDHLVTGLPVAQHQDKAIRAELQGLCQRRHQVCRTQQATVRRATILPQPAGSWLHVRQTHPEGASMRGVALDLAIARPAGCRSTAATSRPPPAAAAPRPCRGCSRWQAG